MDNMKLDFSPSLSTQSSLQFSHFSPNWGKESSLADCHAEPPSPDLLSPKPAADVGRARALLPIRASHAETPALFAWHEESRDEGSGAVP